MSIEFADPDVSHRILDSGGSAEVGDKKEHNMTLNFAWMDATQISSIPSSKYNILYLHVSKNYNLTSRLSIAFSQ